MKPAKPALVLTAVLLLISGCIRMHDVRASALDGGKTDPRPEPAVAPRALARRPAPEPPRPRVAPPGYRIDWSFIQSVEGQPRLRGYVPTARKSGEVLGKSGVTVATGFDLGQHDRDDLRRMDLAPALVAALEPYLKQRGEAARSALSRRPLWLTPAQAAALDRSKHRDTARKLERRFDAQRAPGMAPFAALSPAHQTVLFSLATQYGSRLDRKAPAFWEHVTRGHFTQARHELRNFGDGYPTRRNREADLLLRERNAVGLASR